MSSRRSSNSTAPGATRRTRQGPPIPSLPSWMRLSNNLFYAGLCAVFFVGLVALLSFTPDERTARLSGDDIGRIATKDVRALKNFTYNRVDAEATRLRAEEKAQAAPRVYTWDVSYAGATERLLHDAFTEMRDRLERARLEYRASIQALRSAERLPAIAPSPETPTPVSVSLAGAVHSLAGASREALSELPLRYAPARQARLEALTAGALGGLSGVASDVVVLPSMMRTLDEHLRDVGREHLGDFNAHVLMNIDPEMYEVLVREHFDEAIERDLVSLIGQVLDRKIVEGHWVFGRGESEIVVHRRRGEELLNEEQVRTPQQVILEIDDVVADGGVLESLAGIVLAGRSKAKRGAVAALAKRFIRPTVSFDPVETERGREEARSSVKDLVEPLHFKKGQVIVQEGLPITQEHVAIYDVMMGEAPVRSIWREMLGRILMVLLVVALVGLLLRRDLRGSLPPRRDLVFVAGTLLTMVAITRLLVSSLGAIGDTWGLQESELALLLIPFAAGAMLLRLVLDGETSLVYAISFSVLVLPFFERAELFLPFMLIASITGGLALRQAKTRMMVLKAGLVVGVANALVVFGVLLLTARSLTWLTVLQASGMAFSGGLLSGFLVTVMLPIAENLLGYTTDIKLLELASLENPLLKQLQLKASGSFHHSMMVGSLNEAAAEAIGARALLARVGAYYHDIGKMKNAQYFAENQTEENPHNRLKPHMSALILKAHVKDGLDMAYNAGLPQDIIDFIASHHGTSRIEYFYHKAREQTAPGMPEVREEDFRYPGPRPQTREQAICMISDTVEAATRSLPEKTPDRLRLKVNQLINHKFADGQFDSCDLTLKDLNAIAEAMVRVLTGIYHHRPKYPGGKRDKRVSRPSKKPSEASAEEEEEDTEVAEEAEAEGADGAEPVDPELEEGAQVVNILGARQRASSSK